MRGRRMPRKTEAPAALYVETSAVLRAVLERGTTPAIERRIERAPVLITSRLSLVESSRALLRVRTLGVTTEAKLADVARSLDTLWARCEVWELTHAVCDLAAQLAPERALRTLDALHVATYLLARRRLGEVDLLTADRRIAEIAGVPMDTT
jgi:predicted nucleic acid-binding protein